VKYRDYNIDLKKGEQTAHTDVNASLLTTTEDFQHYESPTFLACP